MGMRLADRWEEYEVLDAEGGERLERWGKYILRRPDPQVIWHTGRTHPGWASPDAVYHRSEKGGGHWEAFHLPEQWTVRYALSDLPPAAGAAPVLHFRLQPFSFKHTGLFPEQAANWEEIYRRLSVAASRKMQAGGAGRAKVLNLFAYTGGATLAAAMAGAEVTHVDAAKGMVQWAKENARLSGLQDAPIRWLVDDCQKFVERERRRGHCYDAILLDPPSYGRGPKGEIWKMEEMVFGLLQSVSRLLRPAPSSFLMLNAYTTGLQPAAIRYLLDVTAGRLLDGASWAEELCLPVSGTGLSLPCGCTGFFTLGGQAAGSSCKGFVNKLKESRLP